MGRQEFLRAAYEVAQQRRRSFGFRHFGLYLELAPRLSRHIVWRRALDAFVAPPNDEEMAVLYTSIEMHAAAIARVAGQLFFQKADEHVALLGFEAPAGVVLKDVTLDADEVAAQGKVAGPQLDADAGGLQRTATFIDKVLVIAEDTAISHLGAGMEAVGDGLEQAVAAVARKPVHGRSVGILQECLAAQRGHMPVGHAVAQYD